MTDQIIKEERPVGAILRKGNPAGKPRIGIAPQNETVIGTRIRDDRIYTIDDVADTLGVCYTTASRIMKDSGRAIKLRSRLYIRESSLFAYLVELEG